MARAKRKPLTKAELRIMEILWDLERGTVADVVAALPRPPLAYTTVLTMLRILEQKGFVKHDSNARAHVYSPLVERDDAAKSAIGDLVASFFSNSKTALALRLMADSSPSPEELDEIKALIARYEENNDERSA